MNDSDVEEIGEDDDILGQINEIRNESYPVSLGWCMIDWNDNTSEQRN